MIKGNKDKLVEKLINHRYAWPYYPTLYSLIIQLTTLFTDLRFIHVYRDSTGNPLFCPGVSPQPVHDGTPAPASSSGKPPPEERELSSRCKERIEAEEAALSAANRQLEEAGHHTTALEAALADAQRRLQDRHPT